MDQLGKLAPTVGGGLGGLPSRQNTNSNSDANSHSLVIDEILEKKNTAFTALGFPTAKPILLNKIVYVPTSLGLSAFDISDEDNVLELGSIAIGTSYVLNSLSIRGNLAYITVSYKTLYIVDISDPSNMFIVSSLDVHTSYIKGVTLYGDILYVAKNYGLIAVDISDPSNMSIINTIVIASTAIKVNSGSFIEKDGLLYVVVYPNSNANISVIDIRDVNNLAVVSEYTLSTVTSCRDISIKDNRMYVLGYNSTLKKGYFALLDISDPSNIIELFCTYNSTLRYSAYMTSTQDEILISSESYLTRPSIEDDVLSSWRNKTTDYPCSGYLIPYGDMVYSINIYNTNYTRFSSLITKIYRKDN